MATKKKAAKKSAKKSGKKMAARRPAKKKSGAKRKPNAAFMKPMTPSAALAAVVGSMAVARTEITKRIWAYIKKNKLQDAINRRMINADEKLREVFGGNVGVNRHVSTFLARP